MFTEVSPHTLKSTWSLIDIFITEQCCGGNEYPMEHFNVLKYKCCDNGDGNKRLKRQCWLSTSNADSADDSANDTKCIFIHKVVNKNGPEAAQKLNWYFKCKCCMHLHKAKLRSKINSYRAVSTWQFFAVKTEHGISRIQSNPVLINKIVF